VTWAFISVLFYLVAKLIDHIDQKKKQENSSVGGYGFMPTDPGDHMGDSGPRPEVYHVGPFEEGPASSPVGKDQTNFSGVILSVYDGGDAGGGGGDAGGGK
jgi:hypothetical protein